MKQVFIKQGQAVVEDVPVPLVEAGTILVQVQSSCISIGTEMSGLESTSDPLWVRAMKDPSKVMQVAKMVTSRGLSQTKGFVQDKAANTIPLGYSAAGIVIEVGDGIDDFRAGDRVACAGSQCAHHAEFIRVPRNLAVPVPDNVSLQDASSVALGAIAMQGVRRASPTLGETFVVIGLGLLGQLTVQFLKANGCRVIGVDLDTARIRLARELGMDAELSPQDGNHIESVIRLTDGVGADGVIITAASSSDEIISTAFQMCRRKGRVVLVGDVGLNINRSDVYQKELDFFISTSYGPGRYDLLYEEKGVDYPPSYVRWTENRNMGEYLRLIDEERVTLDPIPNQVFPITEATAAYESFKGGNRPLLALLSYPESSVNKKQIVIKNPKAKTAVDGQVRLALIGAGAFAKGMHLSNIRALSDRYYLQAIASRTGHNAGQTAKLYGANYATTDYQQVLTDPDVDMVLISTRHNLHGEQVIQALKAGKHVLVEKPLTLTQESLNAITDFFNDREDDAPLLLTGFNRRFSPFARRIHELIQDRSNPMIINYRMNAGHIPLDNWVHGEEGGGRNRGEACHIYDLFTYLTGSKVVQVQAQSITPTTSHYGKQDNFVATMRFEDGSVATLTYTALGSKDYPKEQMEIFVDNRVYVMNDYLTLKGIGVSGVDMVLRVADKGHRMELEVFADALKLKNGEWIIPLWQQVQATQIALDVEKLL